MVGKVGRFYVPSTLDNVIRNNSNLYDAGLSTKSSCIDLYVRTTIFTDKLKLLTFRYILSSQQLRRLQIGERGELRFPTCNQALT